MKRFLALIIIVLVACGLWTFGWFYIAGQVKNEITRFAEADGITAPRIECSTLDVSGFPFHFAPVCTEATITSGDMTLTIAEVSATALFYRPTHLQLFAASPARLADAFTGSLHQLDWDTMRASLRLENNRLARFSLLGDGLVHSDALFGQTELSSADHLEFHLIDATPADTPEQSGATLDLFTRIEGASVEGFDITNGQAVLDAEVTALPAPELLSHPQALRLWQVEGGTLTLRGLNATADGLALEAAGQASLDEVGQVNATLTLSSNGVIDRFPGLAQDPAAALLLGNPGADGTYNQNVSVRSGTVFVGILPITTLTPLF